MFGMIWTWFAQTSERSDIQMRWKEKINHILRMCTIFHGIIIVINMCRSIPRRRTVISTDV